jgi:hypothetical protein
MPSSAPAPMPKTSKDASAPHCTRSRRSALNVADPEWTVTGIDLVLSPSLMGWLVSVLPAQELGHCFLQE